MSTIHRGCSIARICVLFLCLLDFHVSLDTWQRAPGSPAAIFNTEAWIPLMHVHETTYSDSQKPSSPVSKSWQDPAAQIFVGLVHYRDRRCSNTLSNIFSKAKYPDRVHVGIVEQIHTEADSYTCVQAYCQSKGASVQHGCPHIEQIKIIQLTHNDARGPNFARYMQESLHTNEEFCLQIDAHSDFAPHWDVLLTEMWGATDNEYAVISGVPVDVAVLARNTLNNEDQQVPHLCQATVDDRGMVVNLPPTLAAALPRPILAPLYAAGNAFSKCHAVDKVPADPNLQMIFDADEFPTYARLWTRGYDVYTPNKVAVAHDYYDVMPGADLNAKNQQTAASLMEWAAKRPGQAQFNRFLYERSLDRISTQLGFPGSSRDTAALSALTRYGLGTKRSLEQFIQFTGIDTRKKQIFGDRCEELKWTPHTPDGDPYVDSQDIWGGAPEMLSSGGANNPLLLSSASVVIYPEVAFENALVDAVATASVPAGAGGSSSGNNKVNINTVHHDVYDGMKGIHLHVDMAKAKEGIKRINNNLDADAQYLRAKMRDAEVVLEKDIRDLGDVVKHRGKELWWMFQPLDSALEGVMNAVDRDFGPGMGSKVMKVILLLIPLVCLILYVAYRTLSPSAAGVEADFALPVNIFSPASPGVRKHNTTGKQH